MIGPAAAFRTILEPYERREPVDADDNPANPVDFEQREGRVHRFGGHAVRRNIAATHRADALRADEADIWKAAFDAARASSNTLGDFTPSGSTPARRRSNGTSCPTR